MALPGTLTTPATELAMALAAVAEVPRGVTRPSTSSLPIWNMPFSRPLGMPMRRIFFTSCFRNSKRSRRSMWMRWPCWQMSQVMSTAPASREKRVPKPAPATPMPTP